MNFEEDIKIEVYVLDQNLAQEIRKSTQRGAFQVNLNFHEYFANLLLFSGTYRLFYCMFQPKIPDLNCNSCA